jgi:hypothetical protein
MSALPTIEGYEPIPLHLTDHNSLNRRIIRQLKGDQALKLSYLTPEDAQNGRKALLMAGQRELGFNQVATAIEGCTVHIWLRKMEPDILDYLGTSEASHE